MKIEIVPSSKVTILRTLTDVRLYFFRKPHTRRNDLLFGSVYNLSADELAGILQDPSVVWIRVIDE